MNTNSYAKSALQIVHRAPVTLALSVAALAIALHPGCAESLQFDRAAIAAGEVWRLATCYLTHFNGEHLLWDLLMFAALGALCEYRNATRMWACVAAGAAAVTATVYWWFPDVYFYRGLSGLDTALFTLLAIEMLHEARREQNRLQAYCVGGLLIGLAAKIAYESIGGQTIFVEQQAAGFVPLVWDHIVGAAVGSIIGACCGSGRGRISYQQLAFRRSAA